MKRKPARERFWDKVEFAPNGCWFWLGAVSDTGYGNIRNDEGRTVLAHRFAYRDLGREIEEGQQLDHTCEVKTCVNPSHLQPVTPKAHAAKHRERQLVSAGQGSFE